MTQGRNRPRRPARRPGTVEPKRRLLAVCEGAVTEPEYIKGFSALRRNPLVEIEVAGDHGVPRTLVEAAKKARDRALSDAKAQGDENLSFDEIWCVFDVDDHPALNDAIQMARDNGIQIAVSNPSFELWLLLHFRDDPGPQNRHTIQKMLKRHLPSFDKHVAFEQLAATYSDAKERAKRIQARADEDGEPLRNPSTGVYRLTTSIEWISESHRR